VLSMYDESLYAKRAIRAGARGYINKQEATRNILPAIHRVLEGAVYRDESVTSRIVSRLKTNPQVANAGPEDLLSERELQVFKLTGGGLTPHQIAARLSISVKTVETYRLRIRDKLGLKDGSKLLQLAIAWTHDSDLSTVTLRQNTASSAGWQRAQA
jgi:DNA-binding NarL/FixJ family response regulator